MQKVFILKFDTQNKPVELVNGGSESWVQIAPYGTWEGHPSGPFTFDDEAFANIVKEFKKQQTPPNVDYEHESLNPSTTGPKPAAGWIMDLDVREDGLWALVQWTKRAADYIRAGEYKFISPAVAFDDVDRKTGDEIGAVLQNIALTNLPFLDGMQPVSLTRVYHMGNTIKETHTVETPVEAQAAQSTEMADNPVDATAAVDAIAAAAEMEPAAVVAALLEQVEEVAKLVAGVMSEDGSDAESESTEEPVAATDDMSDVIAASRVDAMKDDRIALLSRQVEELQTERQKRLDEEAERCVDEKIKEGYVLPNNREDALWLFKADRSKFDSIYASKVVPINVDQITDPNKKVTRLSDLGDEDRRFADNLIATGWYTEQKAIEKVLANRKN